MRARGSVLVMALAFVLAPAVTHAASRPQVVRLVISNFRYCKQAPCSATDSAYLRSPDGGALVENPSAAITVRAGSIVQWVYRGDRDQAGCDSFNYGPASCPGHEVRFENGKPEGGKRVGFAMARQSVPQVITFRVPKSSAGRTLRYFCNVNSHWMFGQTGALKVTK